MRYSPMHNFSVEKKLQDFCDSQLPIYGLCITAKFIFICFQGSSIRPKAKLIIFCRTVRFIIS
jgi:hypothetical protein